jgi:hypothetical protein
MLILCIYMYIVHIEFGNWYFNSENVRWTSKYLFLNYVNCYLNLKTIIWIQEFLFEPENWY